MLRIDNIDPPREVAGSAHSIIRELASFGMRPDGKVQYQGTRFALYRAACEQLLEEGQAYYCGCSRADLPPDGVYPGTCREGLPPGGHKRSIRIRIDPDGVEFLDGIQGHQSARLEQVQGDFVIWRADNLPSYQLATALDDAAPGITEVVRGADLLDSTFRQIHVQRLLGLRSPEYAHIPVAAIAGTKLSKRLNSDPLAGAQREATFCAALRHLGLQPPAAARLDELWAWAMAAWDISRVPAVLSVDLKTVGGQEG